MDCDRIPCPDCKGDGDSKRVESMTQDKLRLYKTSDLQILAQAVTLELLSRQANHVQEPLTTQQYADLIELSEELRRRITNRQPRIKPETKEIIAAMKDKRIFEGLSIRQLSANISVSFATLARLERGEGNPSRASRAKIAKWLADCK